MKRRPHPETLITRTCDLRVDADVYGWQIGICEYCEAPSADDVCGQCKADLEIPEAIRA